MPNAKLAHAKREKNDEFYTQWADIEREVNAYLELNPDVFRDKVILCPCDDPEWSNFTKFFALHFETFGLKKFISTSYAPESKPKYIPYQISMFEQKDPKFDKKKTRSNGKFFILDRANANKDGKINIDDLKWDYLKGDGDFRSDEVKKLRDEADIIITNPPFSLFREFLAWIVEAGKQFVIIGNMNAITYKEVFSLIKENKLWLGRGFKRGCAHFLSPAPPESKWIEMTEEDFRAQGISVPKGMYVLRVAGLCWFTNIDHGRRHQPIPLMTMSDNLKFSKHEEIKGLQQYQKYDNYNAIEVPFTDAIPSDYDGAMGVPISFLDKYCPEQFEILALGIIGSIDFSCERKMEILKDGAPTGKYTVNAKGTLYRKHDPSTDTKPPAFKDCETGELYQSIYARIIIKRKGVKK